MTERAQRPAVAGTGTEQAQARPPAAAVGQPGGQAAAPGSRKLGRPGWKAVAFVLAAVAIVAGAAWALLGSRFLVVRSVRVTGTGALVSRTQVLAAARIPLGQPLIRIDDAAVARRVGQLRQVQSAQVSTDWPDTVVIAIRQRVPVFAVTSGGGYAVVDRFGVSVRQAARHPAGLPLLIVGGPGQQPGSLRGNPAVQAAATVLGELPGRIVRQVRTVTAATASNVSVRLTDGTMIVWGDTGRAREKARELTVLMHTHARLCDVSGPGTAVTKG